jgi:enamine deaminase RidA (YjgF/YER057c/UK114 family)
MPSGSVADVIPAVRARRIEGAGTVEVFFLIAPGSTRDDERGQFASVLAQALAALSANGLGPSNIVCGWIHFAKAPGWDWREALASGWEASGPLPISAIVQPPAAPFCFCTMQLHAIRSARQSGVWYGNSHKPAAATILRAGARHLRLMSITPHLDLRKSADVVDMTYDMLAQAGHALTDRGLAFQDVVRTWIHVRDIEHNYGFVNQARNRFFAEQKLARLPASTCVEGALAGAAAPVAMDLYAVAAKGDVRVQAVAPDPMGEASAYGSAFARGCRIVEPGRKTVYISGTASIDAHGAVVAVGDVKGQLDRMFENLRALLAGSGIEIGDVASATAYLKRKDDFREFLKAASAHGLSAQTPTAVVVADICRPEWLCEIEVCAVQAGPDLGKSD